MDIIEELCGIIAKESQCPSCQKELQSPKVLTCSHTFCLKCVKRLAIPGLRTSSNIKCPVCRAETVLPSGGASCLPTNSAMVSVICALNGFKIKHGLEEKVAMWKFTTKEIDLPSKDCANGLSRTHDNRVGIVDRFGGIHLYSPNGTRETILPNEEKVQGIVFFKNGRFAVLFSDNSVRLYNALSKRIGVKFETLNIEDGGCSVLTGDPANDLVYVGYSGIANNMIQTFTQEGKLVGEVPCIGLKVKKILAVSSQDLLVVDDCYKDGEIQYSRVHLIDRSGNEKWSTRRERAQAQLALGQDDTVLISWLTSDMSDTGLLTVLKYSNDMKDMETLISDYDVTTSTNPSYHLQQFSSGELAFCTADKLYIITRISDFA